MKRPVEWTEWVRAVRQEIDPLEDMGEPYGVDADGDPLDPDLFLDVLSELESRGVPKDSLVAAVAPEQVAGLLVRVNFLERQPAALDGPELPEDVTLYGVSVRPAVGFPPETLVVFDPDGVSLTGQATYPSGIAVVENLSRPDLDDAPISIEDVRRAMFPDLYPGVQGGEPGEDAPDTEADADPERRGTRFVEDVTDEFDEEEGDV
jgi:hypothetical protein